MAAISRGVLDDRGRRASVVAECRCASSSKNPVALAVKHRPEDCEEETLIPTRYRAKLPKQLSYPVGAEIISTALSGAAHPEALSMCFYAHEGVPIVVEM